MENEKLDLVMTNASVPLLDPHKRFELKISKGKWTSIVPLEQPRTDEDFVPIERLEARPANGKYPAKWDLQGKILLPGLVDAHMHIDKAYSLGAVKNASGTLYEAIQNYREAAPRFTKVEIKKRMIKSALHALSYGTTTIRSHLDFNLQAGIEAAMRTVHAALEIKEALKGTVDLQFFLMCPYDLLSRKEMEAVEEALKMGIDGLGGAPHLSETPDEDIDLIFQLAGKYEKAIDLHADESDDPSVQTVEYIAGKTIQTGYQGRVTVDHLVSLSAMEDRKADILIRKMADAKLTAITLPAANMFLQGRGDRGIVRRGITRVKELMEAGVPLATASDNVQDPFHPFGRGDLLQIGLLTAYAAHLASEEDLANVVRMVTEIPAAILGLKNYGTLPGEAADFVIMDARSINELFTWLPVGRWVFRSGKWIYASRQTQTWHDSSLTQLFEKVAQLN